jgi:glycosyltransferase involved in cell wall biosynthesis
MPSPQVQPPPGHGPLLSVIVPARNATRTIEACLRALQDEATRTPFELLVVDNGSRDDTIAKVRGLGVPVLEIPPGGFVSGSRNVGVRETTAPIVAFVDSDCVIRPGWAAALLDVLTDASIGAAGGKYDIRDESSWVERGWDLAHHVRLTELRDVTYVPGGNLATPRRVFLEVGGFDETLETGEDPDLCKRIVGAGYRVVESPTIRTVHLGEPRTLAAVFRRQRWHGRGLRLRYANGRIAPIAILTGVAALAALTGIASIVMAVATGQWWWLAGMLLPFVIPTMYALRYAKAPRLAHAASLVPIYAAYFLGRVVSLPVALRRALG